MKVSYEKMVECLQMIYEKAGVTEEHARYQAENLVSSEAKGIWSHGIGLAKRHLEDVIAGKINLSPNIRIERIAPSSIKVDGDNALGAAVAVEAVKAAVEAAKESGCVAVTVTGGNHYGAGQYFVELATSQNMIIYMCANGDATMAPWGGKRKYLGTNPYTYGAPAGKYPTYLLDMATTVGAARKVQQCKMDGVPAPEGWGIDADGNATTDPVRILDGGSMLPFGGPKGYGLAGMVDIMAGVLTGGAYQDDICCMPIGDSKVNNGFYIQVINIENFMPAAEFNKRMETLIEDITSIPAAQGFKEVLYPGELEGRKLKAARESALELSGETVSCIKEMADMVGLDVKQILTTL